MSTFPAFEAFAAAYEAGTPQVVYTRLIDDLETPVSAYLKIGHGRPYAFLFESVEGGAWRGRYSILTLEPDLIWRCRGNVAEVSQGEDLTAGRYQPDGEALASLKELIRHSRLTLPEGVPPMAAGVFGTLGYDMVRLAEAPEARTVVTSTISWATESNTATIEGRVMIASGRPNGSGFWSGRGSARRTMS